MPKKYTERELLGFAGQHINVARDALAECFDREGEPIADHAVIISRVQSAAFALDEAICNVPLELIENPRPLTKF